MSRNLGRTDCRFCGGTVMLVEIARSITRDDCGGYFDERDGYAYENAIVSNAECEDCLAQYLAWIDLSRCRGYGTSGYFQPMKEQTHFDLSFRSTFNDEPGESDLPRYAIRTVRTRDAWPTCATCKKRIHLSYGCQCPESERILDEAKVVEQKNDKERQARLAALLQQHRSVTNSLLMQFGELTAELRNR